MTTPPASAPSLDEALAGCMARARAAWATLSLDETAFAAYLGARLNTVDAEALAGCHVEDLYLACACLQGNRTGLGLFESQVLARTDPVIRRYQRDAAFVDEVRQTLRKKLFMPPPRLAEYSGQGPLVAWVRAAAARTALNALRPEARRALLDTDELDALPYLGPDPDLAILRGRHQTAFRAAFQAALASLPTRERAALKLNALDGVSLEKIGLIYGVDKSSVSRWLNRAQQTLLTQTRAHLQQDLGLPTGEVDSLMHALQSQLATSLSHLLEG
jgi:RNA polymerase sigma-70 factor (ECF subfamily)